MKGLRQSVKIESGKLNLIGESLYVKISLFYKKKFFCTKIDNASEKENL